MLYLGSQAHLDEFAFRDTSARPTASVACASRARRSSGSPAARPCHAARSCFARRPRAVAGRGFSVVAGEARLSPPSHRPRSARGRSASPTTLGVCGATPTARPTPRPPSQNSRAAGLRPASTWLIHINLKFPERGARNTSRFKRLLYRHSTRYWVRESAVLMPSRRLLMFNCLLT